MNDWLDLSLFISLIAGVVAGCCIGYVLALGMFDKALAYNYQKYCIEQAYTKAQVLVCQSGTYPWENKRK